MAAHGAEGVRAVCASAGMEIRCRSRTIGRRLRSADRTAGFSIRRTDIPGPTAARSPECRKSPAYTVCNVKTIEIMCAVRHSMAIGPRTCGAPGMPSE